MKAENSPASLAFGPLSITCDGFWRGIGEISIAFGAKKGGIKELTKRFSHMRTI